MYVCVYVCMNVCMHGYTYVRMYVGAYVRTCSLTTGRTSYALTTAPIPLAVPMEARPATPAPTGGRKEQRSEGKEERMK